MSQLKELGVNHTTTKIDGVVTDELNKLVTSPAYMYEGAPHEIHNSVGLMVDETLKLA